MPGLGVVCLYRANPTLIFPVIRTWPWAWEKCLAFNFLENFNFPYISQSIRNFWRRWHIFPVNMVPRLPVFSSWRKPRLERTRNCFGISVIVFFLCGVMAGASLTFVRLGLYSRPCFWFWSGLNRFIHRGKMPRGFRHLYALFVVHALAGLSFGLTISRLQQIIFIPCPGLNMPRKLNL